MNIFQEFTSIDSVGLFMLSVGFGLSAGVSLWLIAWIVIEKTLGKKR